jgi:hypothetical protein
MHCAMASLAAMALARLSVSRCRASAFLAYASCRIFRLPLAFLQAGTKRHTWRQVDFEKHRLSF